MKKYELLKDDTIDCEGITLYRIRALKEFGDVKAGDIGGYVESEDNLSHDGDCWIYDDAMVYANARIVDNEKVLDDAMVYANARIFGREATPEEVENKQKKN